MGIKTTRVCVCGVALSVMAHIWLKDSAEVDSSFGFTSGTERVC